MIFIILSHIFPKNSDVFEAMDNLNKALEEIENEETRELINKFLNALFGNKIMMVVFMLFLAIIPVIHILEIISVINSIYKIYLKTEK